MADRLKTGFDKDTSFRALEIVNSWVVAADNKSSILIAFVAILVGFTANSYSGLIDFIANGNNFQIGVTLIFCALYLVSLFFAVIHLILVFIARLKTNDDVQKTNAVSFLSIAKLTCQDYIEFVRNTSEDNLNVMIIEQVNINSKIAVKKMKHFNQALIFCLVLIPLTIIILALAR